MIPTDSDRLIDRAGLGQLIECLRADGYTVIAPSRRDGVIASDEIHDLDQLPQGWTDRQAPGVYRLERRDDDALFGYAVGPHSARSALHPSRLKLWVARRDADGDTRVIEPDTERPRYAFLGLRGCELDAIEVQDRVFLSPEHADPDYAARRAGAFVVAIDCGDPASTCFCTSMGGDPGIGEGGDTARTARYDLALTELLEPGGHRFLVRVGSAAGQALLARLDSAPGTAEARARRDRLLVVARRAMTRTLQTEGLADALRDNPEHPRWNEVAERCLGCANCTLVCPTCFCSSVEEVGDLDGSRAERWRRDDSCFTLDFSYIHGGSVRVSTASRYRQWLTHKLAYWVDQFGRSGCVGCGRCITWCPVGIDLTEEARALVSPSPATSMSPGTARPLSTAVAPAVSAQGTGDAAS